MLSIIRRVVPVLAVVGGVVAMPGVASAEPNRPNGIHERWERERFERERLERERRERREHEMMCVDAARHGASWWRMRELGCR